MLGKILEKVFSKPLHILFADMVATPLGLAHTSFLPDRGVFVNTDTAAGNAGIVNDYNCRFLGGVAGNAGVFSNMYDMKRFAAALLRRLDGLISPETFALAVKNHTPGMSQSRGFGFLIADQGYRQTGQLFPRGAIGHCGHTGQSIFVDLKSGLYAIVLSDMTLAAIKKYGYDNYECVVANREKIHNEIFRCMKQNAEAMRIGR